MKDLVLLIGIAAVDLDSCSPTAEECSRAAVEVHAMELRCGDAYSSPAEKASAPMCQDAVAARSLWESKCR